MTQPITIDFFVQVGIVILAIWGFVKAVREMIEAVTKRHDREQGWDNYAKNLEDERNKIYTKYDGKLEELEKKMATDNKIAQEERDDLKNDYTTKLTELEEKIEYNHNENIAKTQELKSEILILTKSVSAILDGLIQQGCNGKVTEAKNNLDEFLIGKL